MPEVRHRINMYRDIRRKFMTTNPRECARSMLASICIRRIALGMSSVGHCVNVIVGAWPMEIGKPFYPKELESDVPDHCDCDCGGNRGHKESRYTSSKPKLSADFYVLVNSTRIARCV
jgi:hypothetical protein